MNLLDDFIYVSKAAGKKTIGSMKKHWPIIFTGIIYTILNMGIFYILGIFLKGPLYILSGIIVAIVTSALVSNYLYLLYNIINYDRMNMQDFKDGFGHFLWKIYGVLFIGYLGNMLLSFFTPILGGLSLVLDIIIYLTILVLLNPLPETIYLKHYSPWESVVYSLEFIQENWLNWLIPNVAFYLILYFTTGNILVNLFNTHLSFGYVLNPIYIISYLVGQLVFSFMMIYRGHLYKILSTSTRRKRMFMREF